MCRKINCDHTTRKNDFRVKNPSLGRFLHISAEISKFMLQSLGNPEVTSRLVLPLENFLRHLWTPCSFWKHCPGSIECVGKRIVIVRRVEMILEWKTRAWAVFFIFRQKFRNSSSTLENEKEIIYTERNTLEIEKWTFFMQLYETFWIFIINTGKWNWK